MEKIGGMTYQAKLPERPRRIKKNRIALGKLGLMVQSDSI